MGGLKSKNSKERIDPRFSAKVTKAPAFFRHSPRKRGIQKHKQQQADLPSAVGGLEGIVDGLDYLFLLADINTAGVGWIATVEGEQQIQSWEVKDINLRATAWACENV